MPSKTLENFKENELFNELYTFYIFLGFEGEHLHFSLHNFGFRGGGGVVEGRVEPCYHCRSSWPEKK